MSFFKKLFSRNKPKDYSGLLIKDNILVGISAPLTRVEIPEGIEEIADGAFKDQDKLKTVKFPSSIKRIGISAFENCRGLEMLNLPQSLEVFDKCAFAGCTRLRDITIPSNVKVIGAAAFYGCESLSITMEAACHIPFYLLSMITSISPEVSAKCTTTIKVVVDTPTEETQEYYLNEYYGEKITVAFEDIPLDGFWKLKEEVSLYALEIGNYYSTKMTDIDLDTVVTKNGEFYGVISSVRGRGYPNEDGGVGEMSFDDYDSLIISKDHPKLVPLDWELWDNHMNKGAKIVKK